MLSNIKYTMNANIASIQFNNMICANIIVPFYNILDMQAVMGLHIFLIICCYNKIKIKKKERRIKRLTPKRRSNRSSRYFLDRI